MGLKYYIDFTVALSKSLYFYSRKKCRSLTGISEKAHVTAEFQETEFDTYDTSRVSALSITSIYSKVVMTAINKRQLGWSLVTNDHIRCRMRGNKFVTNQMRITFLRCYRFNVFQATFWMSFRKINVWYTQPHYFQENSCSECFNRQVAMGTMFSEVTRFL